VRATAECECATVRAIDQESPGFWIDAGVSIGSRKHKEEGGSRGQDVIKYRRLFHDIATGILYRGFVAAGLVHQLLPSVDSRPNLITEALVVG